MGKGGALSRAIPRVCAIFEMALGKKVLVQLGELSRIIELSSTSEGSTERDILISTVKDEFSHWIDQQCPVTLQIRQESGEWKGMYVDFFDQEIQDKSVFKVSCPY